MSLGAGAAIRSIAGLVEGPPSDLFPDLEVSRSIGEPAWSKSCDMYGPITL